MKTKRPENNQIILGDCVETMRTWPDEFVDCVVTSPPYFGLRDYGNDDQIGMEDTPDEFVAKMVDVFRGVRRVLKDTGTLWLNLGDSYADSGRGGGAKQASNIGSLIGRKTPPLGYKQKDLLGIPWMVAFALRADGWYLRSEIVWYKPNPMPESVTDRPTCSHEKIFLFAKSKSYYYDAEAIRNPPSQALIKQVNEGYNGSATKDFTGNKVQDASAVKSRIINTARNKIDKKRGHSQRHKGLNEKWDHMTTKEQMALGSNKRNVWRVATNRFKGAHFAVFPENLIEPCILAGCPKDGVVLDPFMGAGTTAVVAKRMSCNWIGCELNPEYIALANKRLANEYSLF